MTTSVDPRFITDYKWGPEKFNWWYESIINWMLENPEKTLTECARYHNVTNAWLSRIINSDTFKERFQYRKEMHSLCISATLTEKLEGVAEMAVDLVEEKMRKHKDEISLSQARETMDSALRALGYGPRQPQSPASAPVQVNVNLAVDRDILAQAREKMLKLETQHAEPARLPSPATVPATEGVHSGGDSKVGNAVLGIADL